MARSTGGFKGFKVVCPECMNPEGTVRINLSDLRCLSCSDCDWEGSAGEALDRMTEVALQWEKVANWVEMASKA